MKYLNRIVCGAVIAASVASCAVSAEPVRRQTTPKELGIEMTNLLVKIAGMGESVVDVFGVNIACACVPTVVPNGPPPPNPPVDMAALKRGIAALQAMQTAIETNQQLMIKAGVAQ